MSESSGAGTDDTTGPGEVGTRFSEWRCIECGHGHPKNNPPCDRCGTMRFELIETDPATFEPGNGISYLDILRENSTLTTIAVVVVSVAALTVLANAGVFVLGDPFGLGYRYGAVEPVEPDQDGILTGGEFRALVAADYQVQSMAWSGRTLRVTYRTTADSEVATGDELADIAVIYAEYIRAGGDAARLQITAVRDDGGGFRITVEQSLANRFLEGELTRNQYVSKALGN